MKTSMNVRRLSVSSGTTASSRFAIRPRVTSASTMTVIATQRLATTGSALCAVTGLPNAE